MSFLDHIYPIELERKDATYASRSTSYIVLLIDIDSEGHLRTKVYDKRDYFKFHFILSSILASPAYAACTSQLIPYSRARGSYHDFLDMILETTVPRVPIG